MNKILELEALRGGASLYVFLHHTLFSFEIIQKNTFMGKIFSMGQEAVMIFFLLSGYVISMSMSKQHYGFKEYFKHRFLRIYPIVIIAWLVSFLSIAMLDSAININIFDAFINIMMLQDVSALKPGVLANPLFGNTPLWSLSYEWWFYMLFFLHFYSYEKYFNGRVLLFNASALIISMMGLFAYKFFYHQLALIVMYYYIWFSGAFVLMLIKNKQLNRQAILILISTYFIIIISYLFLFIDNEKFGNIGVHPILELRHYSVSLVGLLLALLFFKYLYKFFIKIHIYNIIVKLFASLAPISFGIYVLHYPIKNYFLHFLEVNGFLLLCITFMCTALFSYIAEIKIYGYIKKLYIKGRI